MIKFGALKTKRGTRYSFAIYSDNSVELWQRKTIRCTGGYKQKDVPMKMTKEVAEIIKERYGVEV